MKNFILSLCLILLPTIIMGQDNQSIAIIPEPVSMEQQEGEFILKKNIIISSSHIEEVANVISFLKEKLTTSAQCTFETKDNSSLIELLLNQKRDNTIGDEGYKLSVNSDRVTIWANKPEGLFYGLQTLFQLLPAEIESKELIDNVAWTIPAIEITDYPRVGWRGLMLDVSRHFFTVDEVKQYIDAMVRYKYNMLHLHLTDDDGWRIEIKSLPKLTEVGAWRVEKTGVYNEISKPLPEEPRDYGGYYTHDDIREIVQYAKDRFVDVMPEIDVPGHSLAAIASYPELSCTEGAENYSVRVGEQTMDWSQGAPPIALIDNTLCPANEYVYEFIDKVITEVAQLFPFEYIHSGGDEAPHNFWEKSQEIKALMKREGLKTIPEVQSYFGKRVEKIIQSKGKKMMGWDEILEGGITPSTGLMSWRGINHGIIASNSGHYVVMSPNNYTYIDLMQGDASTEPPVYQSLRLNQTYKFDPIPEEANAQYVLGGQANLWTEQVYNIRQAEYMTWPRALSVAESLWSPREHKNWEKFVDKTEAHFERLDFAETKYSPAMYDPIVKVTKENDKYYVTLTTEIDGLDIYTSFDNSTPDRFYPKYTDSQLIPKDANLMRIITYRGKEPIGRLMSIRVDDLKKRAR